MSVMSCWVTAVLIESGMVSSHFWGFKAHMEHAAVTLPLHLNLKVLSRLVKPESDTGKRRLMVTGNTSHSARLSLSHSEQT